MARMQKKKPAAQKKDRKKAGDSAPDDIERNRDSSAVVKGGGMRSHEAAADRQKNAVPASRKPSGDQTFLMRLLDRYFGNWIQFLREVKSEMSKVVWPSRKETSGMTAVVLVFVLLVAFFLGIIDFGLSRLVQLVL